MQTSHNIREHIDSLDEFEKHLTRFVNAIIAFGSICATLMVAAVSTMLC